MKKKKRNKSDSVNNNSIVVNQNDAVVEEKKMLKTQRFFKDFFKKLKSDKLYLLSFLITLVLLGFFFYSNIKESDGLYKYSTKNNIDETQDNDVSAGVDSNLNKKTTDSDIDVSDYVGIYSREVDLNESVKLNDSCIINSYKVVYQIKKNKSIAKYFYNECIGTIKMWDSNLAYVSSGGARYISAKDTNYLFASNTMKEVDGETYTMDDDIDSIKEKTNVKNIDLTFDEGNIIIMTYDNLYLISGSNVGFKLGETYKNNGGDLEQRVYKSSTKYKYNFIVFSNEEKRNCYDETIVEDKLLYTIYSVKYNKTDKKFGAVKTVVSRNVNDLCTNYDDDMDLLNE